MKRENKLWRTVRDEEKSYKGFIISTMVDRKCTGWEREKGGNWRDFRGSARARVRAASSPKICARVREIVVGSQKKFVINWQKSVTVGPWRSWERASMASRRSWVRIPSAPPNSYSCISSIFSKVNRRGVFTSARR